MNYTLLFGGKAGQGPNILSNLIGRGLVEKGFYIFNSREYESKIRGGHNFNLITFSKEPIESNTFKVNILVALDENTLKVHNEKLNTSSLVLIGSSSNMFYAGSLFKILDLDFEVIDKYLKNLNNYKENLEEAKKGYNDEKRKLDLPKIEKNKIDHLMNGSEAIAKGTILSKLEFYYAYPMTPSTGVLYELSEKEKDNIHIAVILESEIAVINAAVGSALTGAKVMVGTSGGGFDLMTEALSLIGMAEVPMVFYVSQRPGPSTGLATYTSQGDLNMIRYAGHGEFPRIIIAPGNASEAIEKTSEIFYFTQKYRMPGIILGDKHLAESVYSFSGNHKITQSEKSIKWPERFNSYESDINKIATEDPEEIKNAVRKRIDKGLKLAAEIENFTTFKTYGKKESKNLIVAWGSTRGAIIDSIKDLDCKFLQILYLEPLSKKIKSELEKAENLIIIENNSTSALSSLIAEKTGILIGDENKILKFDGRPFLLEELSNEIKKRLK